MYLCVIYRSTGSDLGVFAVSCVLLDIMVAYGEVDIFSTVRQLRPHFITDQVSAIRSGYFMLKTLTNILEQALGVTLIMMYFVSPQNTCCNDVL